MEYETTKLASLLIYPLGSTFLLLLTATVFHLRGRRRPATALFLTATAWLWLWSMPATSTALRASLEKDYSDVAAENATNADAAVVLGGAFSRDPDWAYPSANGAVDRYWHGARLYRAGRVKMIVLTGGKDPQRTDQLTEAQAGALFMQDMGVPEEHILLDNAARTTQQHVENVAKLLEEHELESFLLVTSAMHMRRAEAVFRAAGLQPIPVATDFHAESSPAVRFKRFLPSVYALVGSTEAVHEYVGFWYYRVRGWS